MANENVVFLDNPTIGTPARLLLNGETIVTAPVVRINPVADRPDYLSVEIETGEVYVGSVARPTGAAATPPTTPTYVPPEQAVPQETNILSIIAIVLGAMSFLCCPFFGVVGVILAVIAKTRNERLANVALIVSIAGLVLGIILAALAPMITKSLQQRFPYRGPHY